MYNVLMFLHFLSSAIFLGTGFGIAFFLARATATRSSTRAAHIAGSVLSMELFLTMPSIVILAITGFILAGLGGYSFVDGWLLLSLVVFVMVVVLWVPVVLAQVQMRNLAEDTRDARKPLSKDYLKYHRISLLCGVPAFLGVLLIMWVMILKPAI